MENLQVELVHLPLLYLLVTELFCARATSKRMQEAGTMALDVCDDLRLPFMGEASPRIPFEDMLTLLFTWCPM